MDMELQPCQLLSLFHHVSSSALEPEQLLLLLSSDRHSSALWCSATACSHPMGCFSTRCVTKNPDLGLSKETECSATLTLLLVFSL